jgi:hypothetical protein
MQVLPSSPHHHIQFLVSYRRKMYGTSHSPSNLHHPSPPNASSTTKERKKLFAFVEAPVIDKDRDRQVEDS